MPPTRPPVLPTGITPKRFEAFVARHLRYVAGLSGVKTRVLERELLRGTDGEFEIDATLRFTAISFSFLVLIECKHHKNPIKREAAQVLREKVLSVGAHLGAIYSTSPFQRGTVEYAKHHPIALAYCKPAEEPRIIIGGVDEPTFGAEGAESAESPGLSEPIEWDFFWQGERFSAEHWRVAEILTGQSPFP